MSIIVGAMSFFLMPASITETHKIARGKATWLHGKTGWFTEREEKILVNRILRDDPSKGNMHNRQHIDVKGIWRAVKDYDLWPLYLVSTVLDATNLMSNKPKAWASRLHPVSTCCQLSFTHSEKLGVHCFRGKYVGHSRICLVLHQCRSRPNDFIIVQLFADLGPDPRGHISQRKVSGKTPVLVSECLLGTSISHRIVGNISERQSMGKIHIAHRSERRTLQ